MLYRKLSLFFISKIIKIILRSSLSCAKKGETKIELSALYLYKCWENLFDICSFLGDAQNKVPRRLITLFHLFQDALK